MILQKILFPNENICRVKSLYLREVKGTVYDFGRSTLKFQKHTRCKFNTYYNAFSLRKWKNFTSIDSFGIHLKTKGKFIVQVFNAWKDTKGFHDTLLFSEVFENEITVGIDISKIGGLIYFNLECLSERGRFIGGEYVTDTEPINDVNICASICTFRREEYILKNLEYLKTMVLESRKSPLYKKLDIIVSDNGGTLPSDLKNKHIKIVKNKNTGGAGGFTRGMMEMLDSGKEYTHILLMDDDIVLDPNVLERMAYFLSYLKPQFKESFVGGAMFRTDSMHIQNEMANRWENGKGRAFKYKVPMNKFENVILNEEPVPINYFSWWYCCMPAKVVAKDNLPLPAFIKRDDIEYGLRNGASFITLNGINVWHEPFENKRPAYLEYYYIRNQLIMEATFARNMSTKALLAKTKEMLLQSVSKFKYLEFEFYCKGVIDFCKGVDYFKSIDAVQLNSDLRALDRKTFPLEELPISFDEKKYKQSFIYREKKSHLYFRRLTLNGWLLPSKKEPAIVQSAFPIKLPFYRVKTALNVERLSNRGFITHKSWKSAFKCLSLYRKTVKVIKKEYRFAVNEFVERWHEFTNYDFWKHYLFEEPTPTTKLVPSHQIVNQKKKINTQTKYVYFLKSKKVDDKSIYLESRKGTDFASNIFAIAKELQKPEFRKYKVYVGYVKEDLSFIKNKIIKNKLKNVRLVEKDSVEFYKILATSKYLFTDFHLCPQFVKREDQIIVSLWHGTPLKTLGKDCKSETQTSVQRIFYLADFQVYPGKFMEEKMLDVYWLQNIYSGKVLRTGYPRNALYFDENRREQIRKELGLEGKQAIIYMPTFRGAAGDNKNIAQSAIIAQYLEEIDNQLNDNQVFYIKLHNYNREAIDCSNFKHIKDAPAEYDNYEFQNACDLLVTDYSSVFFDFAVSRRKIVLFQYDQKDYLENRGVCIPLSELPFPIVKNVNSLIKEINSPIAYDDRDFLKKYATYDNKDAINDLCRRVILGDKTASKGREVSVKSNKKPNIFVFCGSLKTRFVAEQFWSRFNQLDFDNANYFVLYYDPVMWKNASRLLPMSEKANQIGMWSYTGYTKKEKKLHDLYLAKGVINPKIESCLHLLYQRELVKHFGYGVKAKCIVLWNSLDPNLANLYSSFCKKKVLVYPEKNKKMGAVMKHASQEYTKISYNEFVDFMNEQKWKKRK